MSLSKHQQLATSQSLLVIGHWSLVIELDYLVIGHVTRDLVDGAFTVGGTASYAARTARALGCRVGVITSASPDLDLNGVLDGVMITRFPAATTTTFRNIYGTDGRRQVLHGVAETLVPAMMPPNWRAKIVHLGPVARECDPALVDVFGDAFVGLTPQGWMRRWDRAGRVSCCQWEDAEPLLARADAVVLSDEDVEGDEALVIRYAAQTRLLVVTQAAMGCTVYVAGQARHFPAPAVPEVDPTGVGDIFAAAFFVRLQQDGDPWTAARFANCVAAHSVTRVGLSGTPGPEEVARCGRGLEG
ncbi:MAG: ribokinase [Anaerolineae bacterium]|nr:ribokinase [Anaerolineae bacterium]